MAGAWVNRIVGQGEEDPEQLAANPRNWRVHPKVQQEALTGVLDKVGWVDSVIVNKQTGFVVDGHLRVSLALRRHEKTIPVQYIDVNEEEEMLVLATLDPLAALAVSDTDKLGELLGSLSAEDERMARLINDMQEDIVVSEPPDPSKRAGELQAKWGTALGQVWEIGKQRIVCGDCTDEAVIDAAMAGELATLLFSDPPYGVEIGAKNRMLNDVQKAGRRLEDMAGDTLGESGLRSLLLHAYSLVRERVMADDCAWFVCAPQGGSLGLMMMMMMMDAGLPVRHVLIWVKNAPTFSLGRLDYEYQHEPILFGWKKTHKRNKAGTFLTSVWSVDKSRANPEHATMKPVELPANAILNHTDESDIVFDNFLGSGTTLVASEQLHRHGRGIEIDPGYVAVALERLSTLGLEPKLVSD